MVWVGGFQLVNRGVRKIIQYLLSKCSLTGPIVGVSEVIGPISLQCDFRHIGENDNSNVKEIYGTCVF